MSYDFDPSGIEHQLSCCRPCCDNPDLDDMYEGIAQAEEMLHNMRTYGTIDKPKGESTWLSVS